MTEKQYGYTLPGSDYPAYFNAKLQADGQVALTVRGPKKVDGSCGDTTVMQVPPSEALEIAIGIRDIANEGDINDRLERAAGAISEALRESRVTFASTIHGSVHHDIIMGLAKAALGVR